MHQAGVKFQAVDALLRFTTEGNYKNYLNDAFPVLTILPGDNTKEGEENDEKHHNVHDALNAIAPGLPGYPRLQRHKRSSLDLPKPSSTANSPRACFVVSSRQQSGNRAPIIPTIIIEF